MLNKNKSFLSFLDELAEEINEEKESKGAFKKESSPLRNKKRKSGSIFTFLNDLAENIEVEFGQANKADKADLEAQRRLKAKLSNKHRDKLKKSSYQQNDTHSLAKESLEEIRKTDNENGSIKARSKEGDSAALKRLREAEKREKTDRIREELAKKKNRKRLKDAIIMAEILGPPVSKRR